MSTKTPGKFLGVAAWMADKFGIDVTLVRVAFVVAVILGVGFPILLYFILYFVKD